MTAHPTQAISSNINKLNTLENRFWDAVRTEHVQEEWNSYRRDALGNIASSVTGAQPARHGMKRGLRIFDLTVDVLYRVMLVHHAANRAPAATGVISFFHNSDAEAKPFFELFFDADARFGANARLDGADVATDISLAELFDEMVSAALAKHATYPLPD